MSRQLEQIQQYVSNWMGQLRRPSPSLYDKIMGDVACDAELPAFVRRMILTSLTALKCQAPRSASAFKLERVESLASRQGLHYRGHELYFCSDWQILEDPQLEAKSYMDVVIAPRNFDPFELYGFESTGRFQLLRQALVNIAELPKYQQHTGLPAAVALIDFLHANDYKVVRSFNEARNESQRDSDQSVNIVMRRQNSTFTTVQLTINIDVFFDDDVVIDRCLYHHQD